MKIPPLQDFFCGGNPNCTCARCRSISRALGVIETLRAERDEARRLLNLKNAQCDKYQLMWDEGQAE